VGVVIFILITIINFVVITKGSGRVAEVSARFALDSMPGKQMAIDADLNAGLIKQEEAKQRRAEVAQEADFFGSMDGASKFVRGDAIAGILILIINLVGGLIIGMITHNLSFGKALTLYGTLTIGDGLVAQVPALIISTAAGILVTRVATEDDFSEQLSKQMSSNQSALLIAGGVLGLLGLLPGMPHFTFVIFAALFIGLAYLIRRKAANVAKESAVQTKSEAGKQELGWSDVPVVESHLDELVERLPQHLPRDAALWSSPLSRCLRLAPSPPSRRRLRFVWVCLSCPSPHRAARRRSGAAGGCVVGKHATGWLRYVKAPSSTRI
jgi:flagellar biosynthesis protein FlhA